MKIGRREIVLTTLISVIFLVAAVALLFNYFYPINLGTIGGVDYQNGGERFYCPYEKDGAKVLYCEVKACSYGEAIKDEFQLWAFDSDIYSGPSMFTWEGVANYQICSDGINSGFLKINPVSYAYLYDCYYNNQGCTGAANVGNYPKWIIYYEEDAQQCTPDWTINCRCRSDYWVECEYTNADCSVTWEDFQYCQYADCISGQCAGQQCQVQWLDEYRCSGNWVERQKQYDDCSVSWEGWDPCDAGEICQCSGGTCQCVWQSTTTTTSITPNCPNGICEPQYGENQQTCPADCGQSVPDYTWLIVLGIILIFIAILVVAYWYKT